MASRSTNVMCSATTTPSTRSSTRDRVEAGHAHRQRGSSRGSAASWSAPRPSGWSSRRSRSRAPSRGSSSVSIWLGRSPATAAASSLALVDRAVQDDADVGVDTWRRRGRGARRRRRRRGGPAGAGRRRRRRDVPSSWWSVVVVVVVVVGGMRSGTVPDHRVDGPPHGVGGDGEARLGELEGQAVRGLTRGRPPWRRRRRGRPALDQAPAIPIAATAANDRQPTRQRAHLPGARSSCITTRRSGRARNPSDS